MFADDFDEQLHLLDPDIISVEQLVAPSVPVYAGYNDGNAENLRYERIHLWAMVRLRAGGTTLVGLTMYNINYGGHAERGAEIEKFVQYDARKE
ncbi:MAG: hypothetical protein EOO62_32030 [Hymenobacter sp.]|nr:MAG: hypothetical protein EOO62_32030 [Hymenobacter sp.]